MKRILVLVLTMITVAIGSTKAVSAETALPPAQVQLTKAMEKAALRFFIDNSNPLTGLTRDAAANFTAEALPNRRASIAATGFSLAVLANAAQRGMISRAEGEAYTLKTLRFVKAHVGRYQGWMFHFVDWETGARLQSSEYSTIDTALFLAGALYAAQIFPGTETARLAHELYADVDFYDMMTDGGARPDKRTLSFHFSPESGYGAHQWNAYSEEMILYVLGLGSPTHALPAESWYAFQRESTQLKNGATLIAWEKPLFIHQYSQLFLDLRQFHDHFGNYFNNSVLGTEFNRETCLAATGFKTFQAGFWGLSAGEKKGGYGVYNPLKFDGTVCVGCVVASVMFTPKLVLADVEGWVKGPFGKRLWGRYGLVDSLNLDQDWFAENVLGITVGPLYLSLANLGDTTSIWKEFNRVPEIQTALNKARAATRAGLDSRAGIFSN